MLRTVHPKVDADSQNQIGDRLFARQVLYLWATECKALESEYPVLGSQHSSNNNWYDLRNHAN